MTFRDIPFLKNTAAFFIFVTGSQYNNFPMPAM